MFHERVVEPWNTLPMAVVEQSSLQGFVRRVDVLALGMAVLRDLLDLAILKVFANLSNLMILRCFVMR